MEQLSRTATQPDVIRKINEIVEGYEILAHKVMALDAMIIDIHSMLTTEPGQELDS